MAVKDQEPTLLSTASPAADTVYQADALEAMAEARQRWEAAAGKSEAQVTPRCSSTTGGYTARTCGGAAPAWGLQGSPARPATRPRTHR
jgi:hypothetical protein